MVPSHAFESLAGVRPGDSTVSEVVSRFGPPVIKDASDGSLFLNFKESGIRVFIGPTHRAAVDPIVEEVHLVPPSVEELPCGVRLGQSQAAALDAVRRSYLVTDEYEDSVYFRPSARDDLLASVEFLSAGVVVSVELMHQPASSSPNNEPGSSNNNES